MNKSVLPNGVKFSYITLKVDVELEVDELVELELDDVELLVELEVLDDVELEVDDDVLDDVELDELDVLDEVEDVVVPVKTTSHKSTQKVTGSPPR